MRRGAAVLPRALGRDARWLIGSSWASNLGDGIALAAGPLLVASLTDSPLLVSLGATVQWLPPLVFGLAAGIATDRLDRRLVIIALNALRVLVLGVLAAGVAGQAVSIALVLAVLFLLASAEVFVDNSSGALVPTLVPAEQLTLANARLTGGFLVLNQLAGVPLGAVLFAAGAALPFASQAVLMLFAVLLIARVSRSAVVHEERAQHSRVRDDLVEGVRWTARHPAVRTLVLTIFVFNITFGAAWSVLVLYAAQRLDLGAAGFGLLTTTSALGGLIGIATYDRLTGWLRLGTIMRAGLVIETLTHGALAATSSPAVAFPVFFVFGAHAFVWATTSTTVRQRAVPTRLQGRVSSVNTIGVTGGLVLGSVGGGVLAQHWGVTAPFWFAFTGSAIFVVLIWRQLRHLD